MTKPTLIRSGLGLLALLAPATGFAGDKFVVAPLIPNGVKDLLALNVTTLIASELDFQPQVEGVVELEERPSSLNASCLGSSSCLKSITTGGGGTALVTGSVTAKDSNIDVDLVLFDANKGSVVRRKTWTIESNPSSIADAMSPIIRELLTGAGKKEVAAAATPSAEDFSAPSAADKAEEEDFEFDDSEEVARQEAAAKRRADEEAAEKRAADEAARKKVEEEARRKAEAEAQRRAEEEARRAEEERARQAEARRKAEDEARRKAEEDARRRAEEDARRRDAEASAARAAEAKKREEAAKLSEMQEFDPSLISFGSAAGQITAEDIDAAIQFGAPTKATVEDVEPAPAPRRAAPAPRNDEEDLDEPVSRRRTSDDEDEERGSSRSRDEDEEDLEDLDNPRSSPKPTPKPTANKTGGSDKKGGSVKKKEPEGRHAFTLRARGGYANYYSFHFAAGSFEAAIPIVQTGLYLSGGLGVYGVRRELPYELAVLNNQTHAWNILYPISAGALYKFSVKGVAQPYAGADAVFCQYYKDDTGSEWAIGGRARGGIDIMVHKNFGLNVDAALGMWSGRAFNYIDSSLKNSGFFPTLAAGVTGKF